MLANVRIAFPLISPTGARPGRNLYGDEFTILTRSVEDQYEAMVIYGPANKVFVVGKPSVCQKEALMNLLHTTTRIISVLFRDGKLKLLVERTECGGGLYVNSTAVRMLILLPFTKPLPTARIHRLIALFNHIGTTLLFVLESVEIARG